MISKYGFDNIINVFIIERVTKEKYFLFDVENVILKKYKFLLNTTNFININ
jgi:hypothetical protein